jgi:exodeoxyribonuclease VII small subunit
MDKIMTKQAVSFKANYAKLQKIANELRTQQEPDIDALIPMVEEATAAYKQCKNRIEAVKKAFLEHYPQADNEA